MSFASGDDWPVGVVIHHIAEGFTLVSRWIDCALGGRAIEDTAKGIDSANRRHAEDFATVGVVETVELLNANGTVAVAKIRGLDEPDLEKTAAFGPAGGKAMSVEQFCIVATEHVRSHLGRALSSLRADAQP